MVYLETWDEFAEKAEHLFRSEPLRFRYSMKYRHKEGIFVLKATDDRACLQFKSDQAQDAKKMEKLNNLFFALMARGPNVELPEELPPNQANQNAGRSTQISGKRGRNKRQ